MESIRKYWLPISCATMLVAGVFTMHLKYSEQQRELSKYQQLIGLERAANDSLRTYYDAELQATVAERQAYAAEKEVLDKFLKEKETELYELRKRKASVGIVTTTETKVDTVVQVVRDTVTNEVSAIIDKTPDYVANIKQKDDSLSLALRVWSRQSYELTPEGKLKVISHNPYVTVVELNSFQVQQPKRKNNLWRGIAIGVGVGIVGGVIISK